MKISNQFSYTFIEPIKRHRTFTCFVLILIGACIFTQGADNIMSLAFGVVSLVAMTPLITIQLLGFKSFVSLHFRKSSQMRKIIDSKEDCKIINFR